jgi:hypothetical protein
MPVDEVKNGDAAAATKAALVEKYQREEPTVFAFYGGFEARGEAKSKNVVVGAIKHLFNNFFPVRVLIANGASKEQALEFLRMMMADIERNGVHQAPHDFHDPSETWRDAPPRCALCSAADVDGGIQWYNERRLCRECWREAREANEGR